MEEVKITMDRVIFVKLTLQNANRLAVNVK